MGGSPSDKDFVQDEEPEEANGLAGEGEGDDEVLAVCLVSGGMDSCVTAAIAYEENAELAFLHVSYGQLTEARERRAFEELADFYGVSRRLVVSLEHLARIGGSSLTDPSMTVAEADLDAPGIPSSYVPFRNAHLLAAATSWAEVLGARRVYIGAVAEDSSGYPDCRPEFYEAFQRVIEVGTRPETRVEIRTPVIHLRKSEIIRRGDSLDAPLRLTWSCYRAEERACGRLRLVRAAPARLPRGGRSSTRFPTPKRSQTSRFCC